MKSAHPERFGRALQSFEEARVVAAATGIDPRVRELVERRIGSLRALIEAESES
jgi:hypothetical protein